MFPRGVDPLARPVQVVFALPDGHATLELLDHITIGVECWSAMGVRAGDSHADVTDAQRTNAMLEGNRGARKFLDRRRNRSS
jgi:hypothetical protein